MTCGRVRKTARVMMVAFATELLTPPSPICMEYAPERAHRWSLASTTTPVQRQTATLCMHHPVIAHASDLGALITHWMRHHHASPRLAVDPVCSHPLIASTQRYTAVPARCRQYKRTTRCLMWCAVTTLRCRLPMYLASTAERRTVGAVGHGAGTERHAWHQATALRRGGKNVWAAAAAGIGVLNGHALQR